VLLPVLILLLALAIVPSDRQIVREAQRVASKTLPKPPAVWVTAAPASDVMRVATLPIAYWGRPDARYARIATRRRRRFRAIVVHFTLSISPIRLIKYQHTGDLSRGGSFGYHFYIDRKGRVLQGAPLSKRTNHVKGLGHRKRRTGRHHWVGSHNSIGIGMVGACVTVGAGLGRQCVGEELTDEQSKAGQALVTALRDRYSIRCQHIYGHGELQSDRAAFEGRTLTRIMRAQCETSVAAAG